MKRVCMWMEWMAGHVSPELVSGSSPRVLAALLLHTAWCMEWGDGLPFSKTLVKLVALTRDGPQSRKQLQDGFLFHVMCFLKLTCQVPPRPRPRQPSLIADEHKSYAIKKELA